MYNNVATKEHSTIVITSREFVSERLSPFLHRLSKIVAATNVKKIAMWGQL